MIHDSWYCYLWNKIYEKEANNGLTKKFYKLCTYLLIVYLHMNNRIYGSENSINYLLSVKKS
jgi:hypothetical protein